MLYLKITDKNKAVKFTAEGNEIKEIYNGTLCESDAISIRLDGTNTLAVRLDPSMQESLVYCPNKSFTFTIPSERELRAQVTVSDLQSQRLLRRQEQRSFLTILSKSL